MASRDRRRIASVVPRCLTLQDASTHGSEWGDRAICRHTSAHCDDGPPAVLRPRPPCSRRRNSESVVPLTQGWRRIDRAEASDIPSGNAWTDRMREVDSRLDRSGPTARADREEASIVPRLQCHAAGIVDPYGPSPTPRRLASGSCSHCSRSRREAFAAQRRPRRRIDGDSG